MVKNRDFLGPYQEEWGWPFHIVLTTTEMCNCKCNYCFVNQSPMTMEFETAVMAIDFAYENYLKHKRKKSIDGDIDLYTPSVIFFGGEPLLIFDQLIKPVIKYSKKRYPDIDWHFQLITNGILLDEEKLKFFQENNAKIQISLDGIKKANDVNRIYNDNNQSTFDLVVSKLPLIFKYIPDVAVRATITPDNVKYLFTSYLFFEQIGFKIISFYPSSSFCTFNDNKNLKWDKDNIDILANELRKIYAFKTNLFLNNISPAHDQYFDHALQRIIYSDIYKVTGKDSNFFNQNKKNKDTVTHCGLGISSCTVAPSGKIYPCQTLTTSQKEEHIIGDIFAIEKIFKDQHNKYIKNVYTHIFKNNIRNNNYNACKNCIATNESCYNRTCLGIANIEDRHKQNDIKIDNINCIFENEICLNVLTMLKILVENNNMFFKEYLTNRNLYYSLLFNNFTESGE